MLRYPREISRIFDGMTNLKNIPKISRERVCITYIRYNPTFVLASRRM